MNLAALVAEHPADAHAFFDHDRWWTWGELRELAAAFAGRLGSMARSGDRVVIVLPTSVEFVVAYLGTLSAGAVAVPLNPMSPAAELEAEIATVRPVVLVGSGPEVDNLDGAQLGIEVFSPEDLLSAADNPPVAFAPVALDPDDLAVLLFTSGTAGEPRAAMLSHGNLLANLRQMLGIPHGILTGDDVGFVAIPLFHVFGLNVALGLGLATGGALVLQRRFDPGGSLGLLRDLGVTQAIGAPPMFAAWLAVAERPDAPPEASALGGLRLALSGAAALDVETARAFEERFGIALHQGYGLTEASPAVATTLGAGPIRRGSVGRPLPGMAVRLVDESGEDAVVGDPGEVWVKGPNVFGGYWDDAAATAAAVDADGWLHTGDVGVFDEDGDLHIVDRKKDLIIVSGFNVFPAEVERCILTMPGVLEAAVVGRSDPDTGESIEAVVVAAPGAEVAGEAVVAHCAHRLARYKCPTSVRFASELPHGLVGKALRRALRAETVGGAGAASARGQ